MSWAADKFNLVEYLIHHEDIRRAGEEPAEPRDLPEAEQDAVWQQLGLLAKLRLRKSPVGVRLATPKGKRSTFWIRLRRASPLWAERSQTPFEPVFISATPTTGSPSLGCMVGISGG